MATIRELILQISVVAPNTSAFESDAKKTASSVENIEDAAKGASDEIEEIGPAMSEASAVVGEEAIKVGESFKTATEGAFTMARGIALSAVSSEEDLAKVVEQIARIQGAFDVFKGALDIIKGLSEGMKALKIGTEAASGANAIFSASNVAVASTSTAAATGIRSMTSALAPIAIALAAASAAYFFMTKKTKEIKEETGEFEAIVNSLKFSLDGLKGASTDVGDLVSLGIVDQLGLAKLQIKETQEALEILTKGPALSNLSTLFGAASVTIEEALEGLSEERLADFKISFDEKSLDELEERLIELREETAVFDPFENLGQIATNAAVKEQAEDFVDIENAIKAIGDIRERQAVQRLTLQRQENAEIKKRLTDEKAALKVAEDRFKVEQDRFKTAEQAFGALSRLEQEEVKRIVEKAKTQGVSSLRRDELGKIQPFRQDIVEEGRRISAQRAGGIAQLGGVTRPDPNILPGLVQTRVAAEAGIAQLEARITKGQEVEEKFLRVIETMAKQTVESTGRLERTVAIVEDALAELNR